MNTGVSRRTVLIAVSGAAAFGFGSSITGGQTENGAEPGGTEGSENTYWSVTQDTAAVTVTSSTDSGVTSDGDVYVTSGVDIDGGIMATGNVILESNAEVDGGTEADGAIVAVSGVVFDGNTVAGDDVLLGVDLEQNRELAANGGLASLSDVVRSGSVDVDGSITAGRGCPHRTRQPDRRQHLR